MNRQIDRWNGLSRGSKTIFTIILIGMVLVGLYAFFTSETGRMITLVCCGGAIALIAIGILSERGMGR